MSFGDRGGDITNQLIASGMPAKQAISLAGVIGQCMAKSVHRGAAEFYGPVKFSQPPTIASPQGSNSSAGGANEFAVLNGDLTASSPYQSAQASLLEWSPSGYSYGGAIDVWPGPLMDDGSTIASGTRVGVARNGDRYVVIGAGPDGGSGSGGSVGGGGGGYVAILQGDLAVDGSASARVATYSGGTWAEASPIVSLTVYAAFQSGGETIPSGYRIWVQRELNGNRWVTVGAKAN
jgi:hypothetical protein